MEDIRIQIAEKLWILDNTGKHKKKENCHKE